MLPQNFETSTHTHCDTLKFRFILLKGAQFGNSWLTMGQIWAREKYIKVEVYVWTQESIICMWDIIYVFHRDHNYAIFKIIICICRFARHVCEYYCHTCKSWRIIDIPQMRWGLTNQSRCKVTFMISSWHTFGSAPHLSNIVKCLTHLSNIFQSHLYLPHAHGNISSIRLSFSFSL